MAEGISEVVMQENLRRLDDVVLVTGESRVVVFDEILRLLEEGILKFSDESEGCAASIACDEGKEFDVENGASEVAGTMDFTRMRQLAVMPEYGKKVDVSRRIRDWNDAISVVKEMEEMAEFGGMNFMLSRHVEDLSIINPNINYEVVVGKVKQFLDLMYRFTNDEAVVRRLLPLFVNDEMFDSDHYSIDANGNHFNAQVLDAGMRSLLSAFSGDLPKMRAMLMNLQPYLAISHATACSYVAFERPVLVGTPMSEWDYALKDFHRNFLGVDGCSGLVYGGSELGKDDDIRAQFDILAQRSRVTERPQLADWGQFGLFSDDYAMTNVTSDWGDPRYSYERMENVYAARHAASGLRHDSEESDLWRKSHKFGGENIASPFILKLK